jgi:hypothetical protein
VSEQDVSPEVRRFLAEHVESVLELEGLLLLAADAGRSWTAAGVARELRVDAAWAGPQLSRLCERGVLHCEQGPDPAYRFAPRGPEIDQVVRELADAYATRRVTVISLIFAKPIDKLKSFADAFRIRREEDRG